MKQIFTKLSTWLEKRRKRKEQKVFDKWYIQNQIEVLHQYLFNNDNIDEQYVHEQLDNILDKVNKM